MQLSRASIFVAGLLASGCGGGAPVPSSPAAADASDGTVASADGVPIYFRSVGHGEPAVVLVHCWGCSSDEWSDAIGPLAATRRVVALDLAGHGRSGKARTAWTVPAFAGDVRAVIEHLGIKRAILVGHSMAGAIVVETAVELPGTVVGLVPIDTLHDVGAVEDAAENAKLFEHLRTSFAVAVEELVRSIVPKTIDPAVLHRILGFELANDPAIAVPVIENNGSFPLKDVFARVKVPIIAINADQFPTNVAGNRALAPQYQVRLITGVGHWPMLEAPQRFNALLLQAVADVAAAHAP